MSFDLSRISFDARQDFLGVVMQQGRVQLDADWNEWVAELARRIQAGMLDTVGRAVVPRETPAGFLIEASGGHLTIGPGRIYVDGILAENHGGAPDAWDVQLAELGGTGAVDYAAQPYFPAAPALPGGGPHVAYIDVWQRHVTHLQHPELVEKAVGVDSTGRLQTVWQVRLLADVGAIDCSTPDADVPGWLELTAPSGGRLSTSTGDLPDVPDPCDVPPAAGYTGRENQLYRIEIHTAGGVGTASFKWSRDNATVASHVTHINPARDRLTVDSIGRDDMLRFNDGDWVELTDDHRELANLPGELRRIRLGGGVDDATRSIELEVPLSAGLFPVNAQNETEPARHTRIRRWDQSGQIRRADGSVFHDLDAAAGTDAIPVPAAGTRLFLEHGILVEFDLDPASGSFRSGDYWVVAARSIDASIDLLTAAPPIGIHHHYARLAVVDFPDSETDCRRLWPPVSEGQGCDCTVCVDAEAHNSGTATLQQAIDSVKATGGTVCLGTGNFRIERPVQIDAAQSVRVRGQGWRTVLLGERPGTLLEISSSTGVTLERFTVVGSGGGAGSTAMVSAANVADFRMQRLNVLGLSGGDATSIAVAIGGYALGISIADCVLVAEEGLVAASGQRDFLFTAQLRASGNVLLCRRLGIAFDGTSLHAAACALADNLLLKCSEAAISVTGATLRGATVTLRGNVIYADGQGIRAGTDALRIQDNEITALATGQATDAIVLQPGLDPLVIDNAQIIGNRIRDMAGHGIAIRHVLGRAMIKQNMIEKMGGGGIVMEAGGASAYLVVANNTLIDLGQDFDSPEEGFAGMLLVDVDRADVLDNVVTGVAREAVRTPAMAAFAGAGIRELRAVGNRLHDIGPPRSSGTIFGLLLLPPFHQASFDGNSIDRSEAGTEQLQLAPWMALRVGFTIDPDGAGTTAFPSKKFAYVPSPNRAFLLTATHIRASMFTASAASVRGNSLRGEMSTLPLTAVDVAESCLFAENHCEGLRPAVEPIVARLTATLVNASNNRLIGAGDMHTMRITGHKHSIVMGNFSTGPISVDGPFVPTPATLSNVFGI